MAINHTVNLQSVVYSFNNGSLYTTQGKATKSDLVPHFLKALLALREDFNQGKIKSNELAFQSSRIFNLADKFNLSGKLFSALSKKLTE